MDVMRRAIMQYLKDGNDPRVLPNVRESSVEEIDRLYYVVLRHKRGEPPLKVYRLFNDRSLKGLYRLPPQIKAEYEQPDADPTDGELALSSLAS